MHLLQHTTLEDHSQKSLMDWTDLELVEDSKFWAGKEGQAKLRKIYRRIIAYIDENEEKLKNIVTEHLLVFMQEANSVYHKVSGAQEVALDAIMVRRLCRLVRKMAEEMSANITQFRPEEYSLRLTNRMAGDRDMTRRRWVVFGAHVKVFFSRSPCLSYMYGALDTTPPSPVCKEKREFQRRTRNQDLVATKDTVLKKTETAGTGTEEVVSQVFRSLVTKYKESGGRPVSYFKFVLNPHSFSASVENLFHVSFLVKEGKVKIDLDKELGLPVISPLTLQEREEQQLEGRNHKQQVVIKFSVEDWELMVANLQIKEPMIS